MPTAVVWPSQFLQNQDKKFRGLLALVEHPPADIPDEVTQALARFLVVRTCGYLEKTVQQCCIEYVERKSGSRVRSFARSWLDRLTNPDPDRLQALVARFDPALSADLRDLFDRDDGELRREISLLVEKRNKIAHGENEGIGARKALDLAVHARTVSDWFVLNFNPQ